MKQGFSTLLSLLLLFALTRAQAALPSSLKIAISDNTYPYMFINQQGQPDGLVVDYWQQIAKQQNLNIEFIAANWPTTLEMLELGKVDIHGALASTPEREQRYQMAKIGVNIYNNIFIQRDMPHFKNIYELKPLTIGVIERSSQVSLLKKLIPNVSLVYYSDTKTMYDAALRGELFAFTALDALPSTYPNFKQLNALFPLHKKMPIAQIDLNFAVYKNPTLYQQIKHATEQVDDGYIQQLEHRWLSLKVKQDSLLLGVPVNNPPFMHITPEGEAKGLIIELWQAWAKEMGVKISFVPDSSASSVRSLEQGRIDAIVAMPVNEFLPETIDKAYHLYNFYSTLYYPKSRGKLEPDSLKNQTIAVFANAPYINELKEKYPQTNFKLYSSLADTLTAVSQQEVFGFIGSSAVMPVRFQQLNELETYTSFDDIRIEGALYSLALAENKALIDKIKQGFSSLSLTQLEAIEQRWLGEPERYFSKFRDKIPLTAIERDWLEAHQPIRLGIVKDWPPLEFVDKAGKATGITVDIINIIAKRLDAKFEVKVFDNFADLKQALRQQQVDLAGGLANRADDKEILLTDSYWSSQWAVINSVASANYTNIAQLNNKKVAVYKDYALTSELQTSIAKANIVQTESIKQGVNLLQQGEVDAVIDTVEASGQFLRDTGYVNLQVQVLEGISHDPTLFGIRADYQPLVTMLNKGIRSLGDEGESQIYKKWFDFQINQGMDASQITRLILQFGGAALLIIIFFVFWNMSLRKEVSLRSQAEEKMRFMATHDDLTQLPNRSLLKERLEQALLQHARHNEMLALLFIDLDGFKDINDKYGHDVGDELLENLVTILQSAVRKSDTVSRFGGDEFVLLLTGLLHRNDAAIVAEKVLQQLENEIVLSVGSITIGASIGIAIYPDDGTQSDKLLKVADNLMYRVKQQEKNQYCFSKMGN
ncbi:transporter substrate-binding domain-containing protein [Rheinheimera sp. WS51]|uniref:transporter substrate-binding domain-containing protein n=1 Tax=Rheinheimera sp. WS51 TaxID=3425886 RepID=UPI003D932266